MSTARTRSYRDLIAWQKSMTLARNVYLLTENFPNEERFGLITQTRRSALNIPGKIADGHGRLNDISLRNMLGMARGSLFELETQALLAVDLKFLKLEDADNVLEQTGEVARILNGLIKTLEVSESKHD